MLGREEPVLAVRLGEDPYGLFGSRQGFAGASKSAAVLAVEIVKILLSDPKTADAMRTAILARLMSSRSFDMSNRIIRDILTKQNGSNKNLVTLTKEEVTSIRSSENYNIQSANSLPLLSAMYKPAPKKATPPSAGKVSKTPRKKPTSTELMRRLKAAQPEHTKPRIRIKGTEQPTERSISMDAERSAGSTERRT